ncbi:glycosyltransferase [Cyanobium sp. NIES-981]|uniref:glycosyltransferase n=1 Tax=Cyanobium sp. NIES-981 TaxID=1851505 RepID=UPI001CED970F
MESVVVPDAPTKLTLLLTRAACARQQGDHQSAAALYREVLVLAPDHLGARTALTLLQTSGEVEKLEQKLQEALDVQDLSAALAHSTRLRQLPEAPEWTLLRHAHLLRQLGRDSEALAALNPAQVKGPLRAHVLKNRGEILREQGDLHGSLAALQEAVALDPTCPDHAIALGFLQAEVGALDQGLELLHEAERLISDPEAPAQRWLRLLQVYLLHRRGEYETALAIAQGLAADAELGFEARLQVAGLLIRLGDAKAEAALEALHPVGPRQERESLLLRADWLQSQYRHQDALQLLEPLLSEDPLPLAPAEQACLLQVCLLQLQEASSLYLRLRKAKQSSGNRALQLSSRAGLHRGIYEEFNTNRAVGLALRQQTGQPPPHRLHALSQLLAEESESNAAAFSLLLAARQAGHLEPWAGPPAGSGGTAPLIPRRVLQFWQGEELPDSVAVAASSWTQANPGYEHRIWRDEEASQFINERAPERVRQAYAKAASPLLRADLLRLAWLHLEGGVVASLNTRCRHSLDPWLGAGIDGVLYQQSTGFLGTDFMAAMPGQPLVEAMLDLACFLVLGEQGSNSWFLSGPGMLTLCFARYYRQGLADLKAPPPPGLRLLRESHLSQRVSLNLQWPVRIIGTEWHDPADQLQGQARLFNRTRRLPRRRMPASPPLLQGHPGEHRQQRPLILGGGGGHQAVLAPQAQQQQGCWTQAVRQGQIDAVEPRRHRQTGDLGRARGNLDPALQGGLALHRTLLRQIHLQLQRRELQHREGRGLRGEFQHQQVVAIDPAVGMDPLTAGQQAQPLQLQPLHGGKGRPQGAGLQKLGPVLPQQLQQRPLPQHHQGRTIAGRTAAPRLRAERQRLRTVALQQGQPA